jgi:hypothetical protein
MQEPAYTKQMTVTLWLGHSTSTPGWETAQLPTGMAHLRWLCRPQPASCMTLTDAGTSRSSYSRLLTCLLDVSTSSCSCRSWPKLCIVGSMKLQLLPGSRTTLLQPLPAAFSSRLPMFDMPLEAAAEPSGSGALPLLLAALVTGGPLLPYRVTKRAAVLPALGRLLVCTVTCSN